jgi:hypothetical protein
MPKYTYIQKRYRRRHHRQQQEPYDHRLGNKSKGKQTPLTCEEEMRWGERSHVKKKENEENK